MITPALLQLFWRIVYLLTGLTSEYFMMPFVPLYVNVHFGQNTEAMLGLVKVIDDELFPIVKLNREFRLKLTSPLPRGDDILYE